MCTEYTGELQYSKLYTYSFLKLFSVIVQGLIVLEFYYSGHVKVCLKKFSFNVYFEQHTVYTSYPQLGVLKLVVKLEPVCCLDHVDLIMRGDIVSHGKFFTQNPRLSFQFGSYGKLFTP
jgi:hypothetical protein